MPAYMVELAPGECVYPVCHAKATHRVMNTYNAPIGDYCKAHAEIRVGELNKDVPWLTPPGGQAR